MQSSNKLHIFVCSQSYPRYVRYVQNGYTALMLAADKKQYDVVSLLIELNASIDLKNEVV